MATGFLIQGVAVYILYWKGGGGRVPGELPALFIKGNNLGLSQDITPLHKWATWSYQLFHWLSSYNTIITSWNYHYNTMHILYTCSCTCVWGWYNVINTVCVYTTCKQTWLPQQKKKSLYLYKVNGIVKILLHSVHIDITYCTKKSEIT